MEAAAAAGFEMDASQQRAAALLSTLCIDGSVGARGLYLWGPVGRGKTWLLDVFVQGLPVGAARRYHFHGFFRAFHQALSRLGPGHRSVALALDEMVGSAKVICFDEMYAHEPGDAQLFTIILTELRERRALPMVVTSNYPPDGLLPDAEFTTSGGAWEEPVQVRHASFADGIALIKREFDVVCVDAGVDYRTRNVARPVAGFRAGAFVVDVAAECRTSSPMRVPVSVGSRALHALAVARREVVFAFTDLCDRPVSAADVGELTRRFGDWTIVDVPRLSACSPEAAQRFVNTIDVLCDADCRLTITSRHSPSELVAGDRLPPDVARVQSRLALLESRTTDERGLPWLAE